MKRLMNQILRAKIAATIRVVTIISVPVIVCSLLGTVCEIEAAVDDLAAHDQSQGETVLGHDLTHLCVMTHLELLLHSRLLSVYVCIVQSIYLDVNDFSVSEDKIEVHRDCATPVDPDAVIARSHGVQLIRIPLFHPIGYLNDLKLVEFACSVYSCVFHSSIIR